MTAGRTVNKVGFRSGLDLSTPLPFGHRRGLGDGTPSRAQNQGMATHVELFPSLWQVDGFDDDPAALLAELKRAKLQWRHESGPDVRRSRARLPSTAESPPVYASWCGRMQAIGAEFGRAWKLPAVPMDPALSQTQLTRLVDGEGFTSRENHDPDRARTQYVAVLFLDAPAAGGQRIFDRLGLTVEPVPGRLLIHPAMFMFTTSDATPVGGDLHQLSVSFARHDDTLEIS